MTRFLALQGGELESKRNEILQEAIEICLQVEGEYLNRLNVFEDETIDKSKNAFSNTLKGLMAQIDKPEKDVLQWIVENANGFSNREIRHASQGFVLSIMPLALYWIFNRKNDFSLASIFMKGRETEKLGTLVGAWTGALQGEQSIPEKLRTGLVNGREIRLRGEALFQRRLKKDAKDLIDMEIALTAKEAEEAKRHTPKLTKKVLKPVTMDYWDDEEDIVPSKEDRVQWRKFQKEKTKSKREPSKKYSG